MRKFLAVLVAMMLMLLPFAASAESSTYYASIRLIDPVVSFEGLSLDFTGLGLDLSIASDAEDIENPNVTVAAAVLSEGEEVLSGVAAMDLKQLAFLLSGMKGSYKIGLDEMLGDAGDMGTLTDIFATMPTAESMKKDYEAFGKAIQETMNMEELGEQEIEVDDGTVTAKVSRVTMDKEALLEIYAKLFEFIGIGETSEELTNEMFSDIDEMTATITLYEIDEYRAVEEMEMRVVSGGEAVIGEGSFALVLPESGEGMDMSGSMTMKSEESEDSETVEMDMSVWYGQSDAFEGAYEMKFDMTMNSPDTEGFPASIYMNVEPKAVESGWHYDYNFGFATAGQGGLTLTGLSEIVEGQLNCEGTFLLDADEEAMSFQFALSGDVTETNGDSAFSGDLHLIMSVAGSNFAFDAKVETVTSESVEGKLLAIEGLNARDIMDMTVTEMEDLQSEAMTIVSDAAVKLMDNPGVRAVMSMFGTSYSTEGVEPDVEI